MNLTVALTGALPAVIIVSALLTAVVSVFLLWLYRRAVVRAMNEQSGVAAAPGDTQPMTSRELRISSPPLAFLFFPSLS